MEIFSFEKYIQNKNLKLEILNEGRSEEISGEIFSKLLEKKCKWIFENPGALDSIPFFRGIENYYKSNFLKINPKKIERKSKASETTQFFYNFQKALGRRKNLRTQSLIFSNSKSIKSSKLIPVFHPYS